jgi:hypothetical protein
MQASFRTVLATILAIAVAALLGTEAEAQPLKKIGTFTGKWGGQAAGQAYELNKGHMFFLGTYNPVFFNDIPSGFLDKSAWTCPQVNDIVDGVHVADHGVCIGTDKDGDRVFAVFWSKGSAPGAGTGQFIGGTGKFSGLQGHYSFRFALIGNTTAAWVVGEGGEWRLA